MADAKRPSLWKRLGSPKVMMFLGAFDLVLGAAYAVRPEVRGQGAFLMVAGALLVFAGFAVRRGELRRARATEEKTERKKRPVAVSTPRAKGPRAGSRKRLAGPARERLAAEQPRTLAERLFRERKAK